MRFPRYHPDYPLIADHSLSPTAKPEWPAIGSPANAGAAVQTTGSNKILNRILFDRSPGRLGRELRPASTGRGFQSMPTASLSVSTSDLCSPGLLSSVTAFDGVFLTFIIPKNKLMSRPYIDLGKAYVFSSRSLCVGMVDDRSAVILWPMVHPKGSSGDRTKSISTGTVETRKTGP